MGPTRRSLQQLCALAAALARPAWLGVIYMVALTLLTAHLLPHAELPEELTLLTSLRSDGSLDPEASHLALLLAIAIAFGLALGVVAELLVAIRASLAPPSQAPSALRRHASALLCVVSLHAAMMAYSIAQRPQRFDELLYQPGGPRRLLIIICADALGPRAIALGALIAALLYLRPWRATWRAKRGACIIALSALVSWQAASLGQPRSTPARTQPEKPNVLLLVATSLPASLLDPQTTPTLSSLAAQATRLERAYVTTPDPLPSLTTLLTGLSPHHHGVRTALSAALSSEALHAPLARVLTGEHYATALVGDAFMARARLLDLGFTRVEAPSPAAHDLARRHALSRAIPLLPVLLSPIGRALVPAARPLSSDAAQTASRTLEALDALSAQPFFITSLFSDAEPPLDIPCSQASDSARADYRGRLKYRLPVNTAFLSLDTDDERQAKVLQRCAVQQMDRAIGEVLDGLRARGLDRSTLVVVTALRGAAPSLAPNALSSETLQVPLLIFDGRAPQPRSINQITRDVDVAPTLLSLAGVASAGDLDGVSLASTWQGEQPSAERVAFAEVSHWLTSATAPSPANHLVSPPQEAVAELDEARDVVVLPQDAIGSVVMSWQRAIIASDQTLTLTPTRLGPQIEPLDPSRPPSAQLRERLLRFILEDPHLELRDGHLVPLSPEAQHAWSTGAAQETSER